MYLPRAEAYLPLRDCIQALIFDCHVAVAEPASECFCLSIVTRGRGTQRANLAKNPLRDISRLLVMFKDCLKSCFDQLEKFDLFGFLS